MPDAILLITLLIIFATALTGVYLRRNARDRCLRDFAGYQVTVKLASGKLVWGRLEVFANGLELVYSTAEHGEDNVSKVSYIIVGADLEQVVAVYRYHDELTEPKQALRRKDIAVSYHPNLFRRTGRGTRNLINAFADAFRDSIGAVLAHAKRTSVAALSAGGDKHLSAMGETVIGALGNAYEPLLERYIGRRVVMEEKRGDRWVEHGGILKEYTGRWMEALDCVTREPYAFDLSKPAQLRLNLALDFVIRVIQQGGALPALEITITNTALRPATVLDARSGDRVWPLGLVVEPTTSTVISLDQLPESAFEHLDPSALPEEVALRSQFSATDDGLPDLPKVALSIRSQREVDLCLPRQRALVRHGGEFLVP